MPMEKGNTNKKLPILIISIGSFLILVVCLILFCLSHATNFRYNNSWIKGRHISEVVARYGELDKDLGRKKGYYISEGNTWIMSDHQPQYYWMICDDNEIVCDVFVAGSPGG